MKWIISVFNLELRQIITYRADFWVNFLGHSSITLILAYFLWDAVFSAQNTEILNGYTMNDMIIFYIIAPQVLRIQQGNGIGSISREIYEGRLNKYLLFPIDYYTYKLTVYFAHASFYILQLLLVIILYLLFIGDQSVLDLSFIKLFAFIFAIAMCSLTYFALSSICELTAFWADNIWSLSIILRSLTAFLGGAMIPLSFFPEWSVKLLELTPFPYLVRFPIDILLKGTNPIEFSKNILILLMWFFFFYALSKVIWKKGNYKYTGVGI